MDTATAHKPSPLKLDELRLVADAHLQWLQSEGRDGRRANLSGQDLSGLDLQGIYLPEANLRGATLVGTNFSQADLQGADFSQSILERTNFRQTKLEGANFSRAEAFCAYFDHASMVDANFSHANLKEASLRGAQLTGVKFREASVMGANFSGANLQQAVLRDLNASEAVFNGADMTQTDCRDANLNFARFKDTILQETNLRGASMDNVVFTDTDFSYAIDLEQRYQSQSIESEKQSIQKEMDNIQKSRDEVAQYELNVKRQKKDLINKRRVIASLNELEGEVSESLVKYMRQFRFIAIFWFVVVAAFATIMFYQVSRIGHENLNLLEIAVVLFILVSVLGAHIFSAVIALAVAKRFARYVRLRQEKLESSKLTDEDELSMATYGSQQDQPSIPPTTYL